MSSEESRLILIIDDDAFIRRVIEVKLKKQGYKAVTATNGAEGLELVRSLRPDAVIVDVKMPIMGGEAFCRATNPLKKEKTFLTIVLTARVNPENQIWLSQMENTRFFEKPFSPSKLVACLREYFTIPGDKRGAIQ